MKKEIHSHQQHKEDRLRFQVERMILFTDAVFAIAITLLILEIKVPILDYKDLTSTKLKESIVNQIPIMIGFMISFWVIALYWINHHRTFAYVDDYNRLLVFMNLLFLLSIVVMPFTSALYSRYINFTFPTQVYCFNIAITGYIKLWMWYYIINPKNKICHTAIDPIKKKYHTYRSWIEPSVFLFTGLIAGYTIWTRLFFILIFVLQGLNSFYFRKKYGLVDRFR